jgi:hypothetical protein
MIRDDLIQIVRSNLAISFERDLFIASIENITKSNSPIRFNNFAYAIRELTRHVLARLAPDDEILLSKWYKNETEIENGISRKQRIYYGIHGGLMPEYVRVTLGLEIDSFFATFREIIDRLSKYTHIEMTTFGLDDVPTYLYANQTLETLVEFFKFIDDTREILEDALYEKVQIALIDSILEETFSEIDILATHHSLDYVHTETLNLLSIDHQFIFFEAVGELTYKMQWGSEFDVNNGDGLVLPAYFPFKCNLRSTVLDPNKIIVEIETIDINTDNE